MPLHLASERTFSFTRRSSTSAARATRWRTSSDEVRIDSLSRSTASRERYPGRLCMLELPRGRIKGTPEDFVVEELPAYAPSGTGEHVFVRFTKRDRTTLDAVRAIARALGATRARPASPE